MLSSSASKRVLQLRVSIEMLKAIFGVYFGEKGNLIDLMYSHENGIVAVMDIIVERSNPMAVL